ncbi:hypothetical protein [Frankia gtarii]|uniref:hypothetical protein n=1 Tax=Frankia gtarii TaxID=2950102 RepID=UPI0021C046F6|nr:hypothetical protein [Frankia gtarii]
MADAETTIIVPVNVDALVVNQAVRERGGQGFRRWRPNFSLLRHSRSPEPDPFTNEEKWNATQDGESDDAYKQHDGVYVRWELPEALRQGAAREPGGGTEFPLVPNRWLVVRHAPDDPELTTGWVVESDFLDARKGTSPFLHPVRTGVRDPTSTPYRSTIVTTRLGRALDIGPAGTAWHEPTDPDRAELFLTAVGPGLLTFSAYQPYHGNVFSLHDPLTGVDWPTTLNYQVIGWYSDPAQEELTRRLRTASVADVLAALNWTIADLPDGWTPRSTTYCGRAVGVGWNPGGIPDSDRPESSDVRDKIAVGSSVDEAHAALLAASGDLGDADPALLHALGRGLLDVLDGPDGDIDTAQALHRGWFQRLPGGYGWHLADSADLGNTSGDPASVTWSGTAPGYEGWLARLNTDQSAHDTAARDLVAFQKRLYALWWMHGLPLIPPQYTREQLRAEIDPANDASLAAEVTRRLADLADLQAKVPHGADAEELARSIAAYVAEHPLPAGYELRRSALPPFYQVTDPTVVLAGAKSQAAHASLTGAGTLACRLAAQILGDTRPGGPLPDAFASLRADGLPPIAAALLGELLYLLDPAHAGSIPPQLAPQPWRQPWKPLLYQWRVRHWPVPYGDPAAPNWRFDGSRYHWQAGSAAAAAQVTGRRFLVPLAQHTLGSALDRLAAERPAAAGAAFTVAAAQIRDLDLLSQSLDGLTDAFALRDPAPGLRPPGAIGRLIGDAFDHLPAPGPLPEPFKGWQPSGFTQIRAGQFALAALSVVDEFGQTLDVLHYGDQDYLIPAVADSLRPDGRYADPHLSDRFVQLPPRLLQPARLRFDFVAEHDDDHLVDLTPDTTPVGGWIIPNYVDRSLLCYAPTGAALGELRVELVAGADGEPPTAVVGWGPLPDSQVGTIDELRDDRPQLHAFARELVARGPAAFTDLLSTVDQALAGIDPGDPFGDEVLGALLGRPLALIRARLGFELDGPPITDAGWRYALDWRALTQWRERRAAGHGAPPEMAHLDYRWPIRLGNAGQQGDGLIGYFAESDYTTFYAVATPDTAEPTGYVTAIDGVNWPTLAADSTERTHLTLLVDPRAAVHATTDLLPATELLLPSRFTRTAMAAMSVALRLSPVLTTTRAVPSDAPGADGQGGPAGLVDAIALPHPTSAQGTWDWAELVVPDVDGAPTGWVHQPIVQSDQAARLDEDGPVIRTGHLRLSGGFDAP